MQRIKKGDTVVVIAGKSKGHVGTVKSVQGERIMVDGANMITKHVKPNPNLNEKGGLVKKEASIHSSNVAIYNQITKKADKVGFKFVDNGGEMLKVRYLKSNNEVIDRI